MKKMKMKNETVTTEFILLGFGDLQELRFLLFVVFLTIYIMTITGNLLMVILVVTDHYLHTPMYFFLGNLSCLEICYSTTILPRLLASFITDNKHVPFNYCIIQLWSFCIFKTAECYLLAAMSYDRFLAVCKPLHYPTLMNTKVSFQLIAGSWICSSVVDMILVIFILQLNFCGHNVIDHYFCDFIPIINLGCNDTYHVKLILAVLASISTIPQLTLTITSYGYIIAAILRIPSVIGRKKAFSTCSSHLIVVTMFYGAIITVYTMPDTDGLRKVKKIFAIFYTILTPLLNPLIYSLRNNEVKGALRRTASKCTICMKVHQTPFVKPHDGT
ncbi:olfactory receptor 6B1-like [Sceloporus undulatus]|uniref:olfactory receptor 6B1-like n=1 Tax=Sceloporus undulatus TaxID=8520 RepID=UPI001C4DD701|nr:olfactory receptor 6B1-like [Sceloporus undulatus]